jgi:hypothetical protein
MRTARLNKAFDPSEPRDPRGRWTGGGASGGGPELSEQASHFAHATGDLLTRLGHATSEAAALIVSARALRGATNRLEIAKHVAIIATTVGALHTHITALPAEARTWSAEAVETFHRTREALLKLKAKIFAARSNDTVNKIAFEIRSLMAAGAPA